MLDARDGHRMLTFLGWMAAAIFTACTVIMVWVLHRAFQYADVTVTPAQVNDDDSAVNNFIELLDEARTSMILYDDGNNMDGSVYNDRRVIDAVRSKLRDNPDFKLQCLFNCNEDVLFRNEFASEPQVEIRIRNDSGSESGVHYKIIDRGMKAYLSRHERGARERIYKIVDCKTVSKRHRRRIAEAVLGKYTADFATAFSAATMRD